MEMLLDNLGGFGTALVLSFMVGGFACALPAIIEWIDRIKKRKRKTTL